MMHVCMCLFASLMAASVPLRRSSKIDASLATRSSAGASLPDFSDSSSQAVACMYVCMYVCMCVLCVRMVVCLFCVLCLLV